MRTHRQPIRALDKLDHKILRLLQQDGRMAMKDLAEQVGLSVTPCIERVKRMERDGVITGYHKSGNMFDQFRREVQKIPEVLECHLVSGDFDYLIKARIGEMADYRKLLGDILLQLPGAVQSKSYVVMEEIKETLTIAVGE
jgi:Lrp/AsnC family leucine-responsive transcriptional regulator